jgi:beta-barrel assembly-enhancing protease
MSEDSANSGAGSEREIMNHMTGSRNHSAQIKTWIVMLVFILAPCAFGQRTQLKPGFNLFTPQQDIELGKQVAGEAEKSLPMLNNARVDNYLNELGKRISLKAPGEKYPYQFRCVNDAAINAFALPGGFLFINRGLIEAADNEAELAGVMGHEIGHVALRHGTNQATKSQLAQMPLAILGGVGGNSIGALIARLGTDFALNSVLLKYSRADERQSDLIGAQILYDCNYDPDYMAKFFEKLDTKGRGTDFFSSHPNPENRMQNIRVEISKLGPRSANAVDDSSRFRDIRQLVKSLPPAPKESAAQSQTSTSEKGKRPPSPSGQFKLFTGNGVNLRYPENWNANGNEEDFALTPDGGIVRVGNEAAVAYGAVGSVFKPNTGNRSTMSLKEATNQLIENLRSSNSAMRLVKDRGQIQVGGQKALSNVFENQSPLGGRETDWLVTVMRPEGLVYFVFAAPEQEFAGYQRAFQQILDSVKFTSR